MKKKSVLKRKIRIKEKNAPRVKDFDPCVMHTDKNNIDEFREKVYKKVREIHVTRFPYNNFLYPEIVIEEEANS